MSDSGSDDWGTEELDLSRWDGNSNDKCKVLGEEKSYGSLPATLPAVDDDDDNEEWMTPLPKASETSKAESQIPRDLSDNSFHMILVDLTRLDPNIHSRFDRNSVNDPVAVSSWRQKLEYAQYSQDSTLLSDGTVIPCGSSVWREALSRLRQERPGHYLCPVFPKGLPSHSSST